MRYRKQKEVKAWGVEVMYHDRANVLLPYSYTTLKELKQNWKVGKHFLAVRIIIKRAK